MDRESLGKNKSSEGRTSVHDFVAGMEFEINGVIGAKPRVLVQDLDNGCLFVTLSYQNLGAQQINTTCTPEQLKYEINKMVHVAIVRSMCQHEFFAESRIKRGSKKIEHPVVCRLCKEEHRAVNTIENLIVAPLTGLGKTYIPSKKWPENTKLNFGGYDYRSDLSAKDMDIFVEGYYDAGDFSTYESARGRTLRAAEDKLWEKFEKQRDCKPHKFVRIDGREDGMGKCNKCDLMHLSEVPASLCQVCEAPSNNRLSVSNSEAMKKLNTTQTIVAVCTQCICKMDANEIWPIYIDLHTDCTPNTLDHMGETRYKTNTCSHLDVRRAKLHTRLAQAAHTYVGHVKLEEERLNITIKLFGVVRRLHKLIDAVENKDGVLDTGDTYSSEWSEYICSHIQGRIYTIIDAIKGRGTFNHLSLLPYEYTDKSRVNSIDNDTYVLLNDIKFEQLSLRGDKCLWVMFKEHLKGVTNYEKKNLKESAEKFFKLKTGLDIHECNAQKAVIQNGKCSGQNHTCEKGMSQYQTSIKFWRNTVLPTLEIIDEKQKDVAI
ncbi:hypothetical protein ACQKQC_06605 [Vibrio fortis]|uniref:hypothetical protein n=1 Tax=Vibrio fortis TaxID=212667 RepID=UPI0040688AFD